MPHPNNIQASPHFPSRQASQYPTFPSLTYEPSISTRSKQKTFPHPPLYRTHCKLDVKIMSLPAVTQSVWKDRVTLLPDMLWSHCHLSSPFPLPVSSHMGLLFHIIISLCDIFALTVTVSNPILIFGWAKPSSGRLWFLGVGGGNFRNTQGH